jgi:Ni/Fe-hydrogenase subunit HybB-like protein
LKLTGTYVSPEVTWDLMLVTIAFLSGLVGGTYIVSTLYNVFGKKKYLPVAKISLLLSFAILLVLPLLLILDLGQSTKALLIFTRWHSTSPLAIFAWVLPVFGIVVVLVGLFSFYKENQRFNRIFGSIDTKIVKILAGIGIPLAILFASYEGLTLVTPEARDLWSTPLIPISWMLAAVSSGIALVLFVYILANKLFSSAERIDKDTIRGLGVLMGGVIISQLIITTTEIVVAAFSNGSRNYLTLNWLISSFFESYVVIEILLGLIIPLIFLATLSFKVQTWLGEITFVASLLVLIGAFTSKWNTIIGGQLIPRTEQGFASYSYTLAEVGSVIGIFALIFFVFSTFTYILPGGNILTGEKADSKKEAN